MKCVDQVSVFSLITCHSGHYTSNVICYSEKVGHCGGIQKLVLSKKKVGIDDQ